MSKCVKRIENRIYKVGDKYLLTSHHLFVPAKNSKLMFRKPTVEAINCLVVTYGTPPALRDLKKIYEHNMGEYYTLMKLHKKLKKRINRRNRLRKVS